jgi:AraC-like DNA-binding protein
MGTLELAVVGLAGSGIGTALSVPMVWPLASRSVSVRLMGGGLLGLSGLTAIISSRVIGLLPATPGVNHVVNLLGLALYPLLYLYIREQTGRPLRLAKAWWLWLPSGVYIAVLVVRSAFGDGTRVPFGWMLPVLLAFTGLCVRAVVHPREKQETPLVPVEWIVAFLVVLNAAQVVRMLFGHVPLVPALIPLVVTGGFVGMVGRVMWRTVDRRGFAEPAADEPRYAKSVFDQESANVLLARVDCVLSTDRLFADPRLTLGRLAAAIDSTPHQVSEVLNRYAGVTFHELLNRWRVADVKAQLLDPASDRFTIEGIGASAGFGSRSALYAAFRRLEGITPAQFRERRLD